MIRHFCKGCNREQPMHVREHSQHYAGYWCRVCGDWVVWPGKDAALKALQDVESRAPMQGSLLDVDDDDDLFEGLL